MVADWSALGSRSAAFQADVTDPASIQPMVERILAEFGRIDILVNNAAYNQLVPFIKTVPDTRCPATICIIAERFHVCT